MYTIHQNIHNTRIHFCNPIYGSSFIQTQASTTVVWTSATANTTREGRAVPSKLSKLCCMHMQLISQYLVQQSLGVLFPDQYPRAAKPWVQVFQWFIRSLAARQANNNRLAPHVESVCIVSQMYLYSLTICHEVPWPMRTHSVFAADTHCNGSQPSQPNTTPSDPQTLPQKLPQN